MIRADACGWIDDDGAIAGVMKKGPGIAAGPLHLIAERSLVAVLRQVDRHLGRDLFRRGGDQGRRRFGFVSEQQ